MQSLCVAIDDRGKQGVYAGRSPVALRLPPRVPQKARENKHVSSGFQRRRRRRRRVYEYNKNQKHVSVPRSFLCVVLSVLRYRVNTGKKSDFKSDLRSRPVVARVHSSQISASNDPELKPRDRCLFLAG